MGHSEGLRDPSWVFANSWRKHCSRGSILCIGVDYTAQTVVGSKRLLKNANWARYNLAVSRRKETEPSSSSVWNFNLPGAPPVDFHRFFDGENITQEDLVAWINIGMHHLVRSQTVLLETNLTG